MGIAEAIAMRMIVTANEFRHIAPRVEHWCQIILREPSTARCGGTAELTIYFALKVKSAFAGLPPATVTFCGLRSVSPPATQSPCKNPAERS